MEKRQAPNKIRAKNKCAKKVLKYSMNNFEGKSSKILLNALNPDRVYNFISEIHEFTTSVTVSDDIFYGKGKSHI
jgi:hypothetical protein